LNARVWKDAVAVVAARSPLVSEEETSAQTQTQTQLTRVKSSPGGGWSSSELFSRKIESERPIAVLRTDSTAGHVTSAPANQRQPRIFANVFVPISVSSDQDVEDEELTTFHDYRRLELLQQATDHTRSHHVLLDHPRSAEIFSETVSIDACDHHAVGVELLKLKKSTLDVQQKALPQGYRMIAEVID